MFRTAKKFFDTTRGKVATVGLTAGTMLATVGGSCFADDATATSVTTQMTTIETTAMTILGSVAGVAILLFGGIYGWKYGKKVFNVISK